MDFSMTYSTPPRDLDLEAALGIFSEASGAERGAIFTKAEVVEFILDIVGYNASYPLFAERLLEPSFGAGEFLRAAVRRLFDAYRRAELPIDEAVFRLAPAIRAVELHRETFHHTKAILLSDLIAEGMKRQDAEVLLESWLICDDFLLTHLEGGFTKIVGNPPYLRQEMIPGPLLAEYRRRFETLFDRADLYIPFIERSLTLLEPGGELGFICANRWIKNRYGAPLRRLVASGGFHLKAFIDMEKASAFHSEVIAYPGIFFIARERGVCTAVAQAQQIEFESLRSLASAIHAGAPDPRLTFLDRVAVGDAPWILDPADAVAILRRFETELPTLEEAGCKVGIGVATGADRVFIAPYKEMSVEDERKLPLVMAADISSGEVRWKGMGVLNPFGEDGQLVPLDKYPRFATYVEAHAEVLRGRNVAKRNPSRWYRTIDRINVSLIKQPKLLLPDIKDHLNVVYEDGNLYPHHNLYYILSSVWDLRALQAVLLSDIARFFVGSYSTKMRGGFLRFQAQYLRRIRIPHWQDVPLELRVALAEAARSQNRRACDDLAATLFGLSTAERESISRLLRG